MRWLLFTATISIFNLVYRRDQKFSDHLPASLCSNFILSIPESRRFDDSMNIYFGNLHSHTSYSDGQGSPAELLEWAKNKAHYDFYAITDHAEMLSNEEWNDLGIQASLFSEEKTFIAIRGFEWSGAAGHINVFNTAGYTDSRSHNSLQKIFGWIKEKKALAQFNHPGWMNEHFFNMSFCKKGLPGMLLLETGNDRFGNNSERYIQWYDSALSKGWMVAPVSNADNHFIGGNCHVTAVITSSLTKSNILEAIAQRRVYSSDDPDMKINFTCGHARMGSVISGYGNYEFCIGVDDNEKIYKLELITGKGIVLATMYPASQSIIRWNPVLNIQGKSYVYLKVTEINTLDDDTYFQIAVTAPFFFNH